MPFDYSKMRNYHAPKTSWTDPFQDFIEAAVSPIGDALDGIKGVLEDLPGGQLVLDAVNQGATWVKAIANSKLGQVFLIGLSRLAYGPLAMQMGGVGWFGPQLASAVWALPGVLRGQPFVDAWIYEVAWRTEEIAKHYGAEAAKEAMGVLPDGFAWLNYKAHEQFPNLPLDQALKSLVITPEQLSRALNIRPDVAALLLKYIKESMSLYVMQQFDLATGRRPGYGAAFDTGQVIEYVPSTYGAAAKLLAPKLAADKLPTGVSFQNLLVFMAEQGSPGLFFTTKSLQPSPGPVGELLIFGLLTLPAWGPFALRHLLRR